MILALTLIASGALLPAPAPASRALDIEEPITSAPVKASAWTFDLVPYIWIASISGSLAIDGEEVDVESGGDGFFGDPAFGGFLGHFEANHGPWSFALAPIFISADMTGEDSSNADTDISIHAQVHEAFVAREFADGWDWKAGLRYQRLETKLDISGAPDSLKSTKEWLDPIIGLRYHTRLSEDWSLNASSDIGGFGVGSDFVWNASVLAGYQFSPLCGMQLGYRALSFNFEDHESTGRLSYDLSLFGPIIGVSFSF